jgi:hypothetical protein
MSSNSDRSANSDRARQRAEEIFNKKTPDTPNALPDYETRARDIRQKMQYLRSLRAKMEKEQNDKHGR